jgi:hypothetical protein
MCVQEGNADAGRYQLETAISTYRNQTGLLGSDAVLAGYHLKLGRCVNMGATCYDVVVLDMPEHPVGSEACTSAYTQH